MRSIECCACREPVGEVDVAYSNHDSLCRLSKYRCNQYECSWCDYCDATQGTPAKSRIALPPSMNRGSPRPGWSTSYKREKPRPPKIDCLDLPIHESE